jgi:SAM-dependent methyltransferase
MSKAKLRDAQQPARWVRYADHGLADGALKATYNAWQSHAVSLSNLLRVCPPPARVLSIGCGAALYDLLLAGYGFEVTSVDNDPEVLRRAQRTARQFGIKLDLQLADAFDLSQHHGRYDIAFSAGLVEHWNGEHTVQLIREHARCAPVVQVEVPTRYTRLIEAVPDVLEDAVLYSRRQFEQRVRAAGLRLVRTYPVGGVPTRTRRLIEALLPPLLFRQLQMTVSYSMGIGCVAKSPAPSSPTSD